MVSPTVTVIVYSVGSIVLLEIEDRKMPENVLLGFHNVIYSIMLELAGWQYKYWYSRMWKYCLYPVGVFGEEEEILFQNCCSCILLST